MNLLDNFKIKKKLLFIYIIFGLIPFLCLSAYSAYKSYSSIISEYQQVLKTENLRVKNVLFEVVYLFTNFSRQVQRDSDLEKLLTTEYKEESDLYRAYRSYTNIDLIKKNFSEVADIHIYFENSTMKSSGYFYELTDEIKKENWYKKVTSSNDQISWFYDESICKYGKLHLGRTINFNTGESAILVLTVSDYFLNYINQESNLPCLLVLNNETVFFSGVSFSSKSFSEFPFLADFSFDENVQASDGKYDCLLYGTEFQGISSSDSFQMISLNRDAVKMAYNTTREYIIWMVISVLLPFMAIVFFVSHFSKRIFILKAQMENITSENYHVLSWTESKDELGILFKQMLKTIDSIQKLNRQIYQEKLEKERMKLLHNQMKYEMLSSQINPHFLFNSLETIHMKAEENEDYEVSYISELLGELLQYSLHVHNRQTSLKEELLYAEKYLRFQRIRFDDHLYYNFDVKNVSTSQYAILPMLLQPIIENSIKHGFDVQPEQCCINITVWSDEKFLYISVHDNGIGMNQDALKKQLFRLRDSVDSSSASKEERVHIGLANIYQRIKLFYGEDYTLTLDSEIMQGTTVTLYLPAENPIEESPYVQEE